MDYSKYMSQGGSKSGGGQGGDYSQYMDYSKYMSQGGDSKTDKGDGKGGGKGGDYSQYLDYSKYMSQGGSKNGGGQGGADSQYIDYSKYMPQGGSKNGKQDKVDGKSGGKGGDYSQYMDYSKYMSQGGSKSGGGQGGDYSQYMDYSKYMSQGGGKGGAKDGGDAEKISKGAFVRKVSGAPVHDKKRVTKDKSNADDIAKDAPSQKVPSEIALSSRTQTWITSRAWLFLSAVLPSAGLIILFGAMGFSRLVRKANDEELGTCYHLAV